MRVPWHAHAHNDAAHAYLHLSVRARVEVRDIDSTGVVVHARVCMVRMHPVPVVRVGALLPAEWVSQAQALALDPDRTSGNGCLSRSSPCEGCKTITLAASCHDGGRKWMCQRLPRQQTLGTKPNSNQRTRERVPNHAQSHDGAELVSKSRSDLSLGQLAIQAADKNFAPDATGATAVTLNGGSGLLALS